MMLLIVFLPSDSAVTRYLQPPRQLPRELLAGPGLPSFLTPLVRSGSHHQFPTPSFVLPGYLRIPGLDVSLKEPSPVGSTYSTKFWVL